MKRQYFRFLDIGERRDEIMQRPQIVIIVRPARHQHVPNPNGLILGFQILSKRQNISQRFPGKLPVFPGVNFLDIKEHQIRHGHQSVKGGQRRFVFPKRFPRGIERRVDYFFFKKIKNISNKLDNQNRLAPRHRDAAVIPPIEAIAQCLREYRLRRHEFAPVFLPCIRVVAIGAAHPATLHEHDKAHPGAVHRAETFKRVNASLRHSI